MNKLKNSTNTNLLILDEIFDSSLDDASGTDEFMRILSNKLAKENVFVISHKGDTLLDKFTSVLKFEKYKKLYEDGIMAEKLTKEKIEEIAKNYERNN